MFVHITSKSLHVGTIGKRGIKKKNSKDKQSEKKLIRVLNLQVLKYLYSEGVEFCSWSGGSGVFILRRGYKYSQFIGLHSV